jgi:hypothetical protein
VDIQINKTGIILEGDDSGWYVRVEPASENVKYDLDYSGSYLILIFNTLDDNDPNGEGFDSWVENFESLKGYFQESSWKVKWLKETPNPL